MNDRSPSLEPAQLLTDRLVLRRPDERDVPAIIGAVGDREVAVRLARVPHPYDAGDAMFFLQQVVPNEWVWAITERGSDDLIGAIGLTPGERADSAELGYWLARAHWGRGLATEAARVVTAYGFATLGLACITSGYFVANPASGRVLEKLGFVKTGRAMRPCLAVGSEVASIEMCLSRSEEA